MTPNTYHLNIHAMWCIFPKFNVEHLRPYLHRPNSLDSDSDAGLAPLVGTNRALEHEAQERL